MSNLLLTGPDDRNPLLANNNLLLGQTRNPLLGGTPHDAPALPVSNLTAPVESNLDANPFASPSDLALMQAKEILDAVRERRLKWQDAKKFLDPLSEGDKKTLTLTRPNLDEDEKRALGMSVGGGG